MLTNNLKTKLNQFYSFARSLKIKWFAIDFERFFSGDKQFSEKDIENWLSINSLDLNKLGTDYQVTPNKVIFHFYEKEDINIISSINRDELEKLLSSNNSNYEFTPDNNEYSFKFLYESVLKSTDVIPQLFLYKIRVRKANDDKRFNKFNLNKKNAHYHFIFQALEALNLIRSFDASSVEEGVFFINKNKEKIDKLLKNIKHVKPKFLGGGADGVAFDIGNQQVLKLFTSHNSYTKAMQSMIRIHSGLLSAKTEPMMYDVDVLGKCNNVNIYYYIIEKMHVVEDEDIYHNILMLLLDIKEFSYKIVNDIPELKTIYRTLHDKKIKIDAFDKELNQLMPKIISLMEQKYFKKDMYDKILKINKNYSLHRNWLELLIEEVIVKVLTDRTDLNASNIGITNNGQLRFFDPVI